ncbi:MAG: hypothetical protein KGL39_08025 [Patescibacteria group bacterium]|nr:hypothetical protein [Patescibacteria group bacterium]
MTYTYSVQYDPLNGRPTGILRSDGAGIPLDQANGDFQAFLAWNAQQQTPLDYTTSISPTARVPRTLPAIYADLVALTAAQKTNAWADLSSGTPAKYLDDNGTEPGAIAVLDWAVRFSGLGTAAVTDAKMRIAAIYCRDNPLYLVKPAFDPTINVPGDALAT